MSKSALWVRFLGTMLVSLMIAGCAAPTTEEPAEPGTAPVVPKVTPDKPEINVPPPVGVGPTGGGGILKLNETLEWYADYSSLTAPQKVVDYEPGFTLDREIATKALYVQVDVDDDGDGTPANCLASSLTMEFNDGSTTYKITLAGGATKDKIGWANDGSTLTDLCDRPADTTSPCAGEGLPLAVHQKLTGISATVFGIGCPGEAEDEEILGFKIKKK